MRMSLTEQWSVQQHSFGDRLSWEECGLLIDFIKAAMVYETSYDTGLRPFKHDKNRGRWSSPMDFLFACVSHGFKLDAILIIPTVLFAQMGIYILIPYFITLVLCIVPIVFLQSFLGQFSSTGFISVFRIAPLFKGIGYVSLAINIITLSYYSIFGAIPLFYLFHSLRPTIPWSCEGSTNWLDLSDNMTSICDRNITFKMLDRIKIPSVEFFRYQLDPITLRHNDYPDTKFSWLLMVCSFIIWSIVGAVLVRPIEMIGRFIRYSCIAVLVTLGLCVLRFAFLPGALEGFKQFFDFPAHTFFEEWLMIPFLAFAALGPGWGSILTMASYNKFKTNIFRYSWLLCAAQFSLMLGLSLVSISLTNFMTHRSTLFYQLIHTQWMDFLIPASAIALLEAPNLWSVLYFAIWVLGCLNLLIVQLVSVMTSLFDEFELLRKFKRKLNLAAVAALALSSIYFCSNHGMAFFENLIKASMVTQMLLNLLLLLVVLWVYGRIRFQKDLRFMTNRTYPTWMVHIVRFVAPLFLLFGLFSVIVASFILLFYKSFTWFLLLLSVIIVMMPWCFVPGYCIYKLVQTSGLIKIRFKRCVRPTDWYPAEADDRQRYEEAFSETETSHQLTADNFE